MSEAGKAYERALSFLEKRDRTESEVKDRLLKAGFSEEAAGEALERLREAGLVNDEDYAARYIDSLMAKGRGKLRIAAEMRKKGLSGELIRNTLEDRNPDADERARALAAAGREWALIPEGADRRKAAMKVSRKLVSLGYTYEAIGEVMSELMKDDGNQAGDA